jgi:hypothetical protein
VTIPPQNYDEVLANIMPWSVLAFLANYCQTVGAFRPFRDTEDDQPVGHHLYAFGFRFAEAFIHASTSCYLELRVFASPDTGRRLRTEPGELVMQYHTHYLAADRMPFELNDDRGSGVRSGLKLSRGRASIRHNYNPRSLALHPMQIHRLVYERVSSLSLSILNTADAPYTIILLMDDDTYPTNSKRSRGWSHVWTKRNSFFPNAGSAEANGLRLCGRCVGLNQFFLMALTIFERWEEEWMSSLDYLDDVAAFSVSAPPPRRILRYPNLNNLT